MVLSGIHEGFTWDVKYSHSGELLASSCNEGIISVHTTTSDYSKVATFKTSRKARDLSFSLSDSLLAVSNHGSPTTIWSTADYTCLYELSSSCIGSVVAFLSDDVILTGTEKSVGVVRLENPQECVAIDGRLIGRVGEYALAVHIPTNRIAFIKSIQCHVVDADSYDTICTLDTGICNVIEFDSDTGDLVTADSVSHHVIVWDAATGSKKGEYSADAAVWGLSIAAPSHGEYRYVWYVFSLFSVHLLVLPPVII